MKVFPRLASLKCAVYALSSSTQLKFKTAVGHQMCAQCTVALCCCHNKPNPTTSSLTPPTCPFCRSIIVRLVVARMKCYDDTGCYIGEDSTSKLRTLTKSMNAGSRNWIGSKDIKLQKHINSMRIISRKSPISVLQILPKNLSRDLNTANLLALMVILLLTAFQLKLDEARVLSSLRIVSSFEMILDFAVLGSHGTDHGYSFVWSIYTTGRQTP